MTAKVRLQNGNQYSQYEMTSGLCAPSVEHLANAF